MQATQKNKQAIPIASPTSRKKHTQTIHLNLCVEQKQNRNSCEANRQEHIIRRTK